MLVAAVPLMILSNTVKGTLLNADFYAKQLDKVDAYSALQSGLIDTFVSQLGGQPLAAGVSISKDQMRSEISAIFTKDWIKNESNKLIRNTLYYLRGDAEGLVLKTSVKPKLAAVVTAFIVKQSPDLPADFVSEQVNTALLKDIPDPYDVTLILGSQRQSFLEQMQTARSYIMSFMGFSALLPIIAIVSVILIFIIVRSISETAKIIGWPLFVSSLPVVIMGYLAPSILTGGLTGVLGSPAPSAGQQDQLAGMVAAFIEPIVQELATQYLYLMIISIALIAVSLILPRMSKKGAAKEKEEEKEEEKEVKDKKKAKK